MYYFSINVVLVPEYFSIKYQISYLASHYSVRWRERLKIRACIYIFVVIKLINNSRKIDRLDTLRQHRKTGIHNRRTIKNISY